MIATSDTPFSYHDMNRLALQLLAFLIFIVNHIINFYLRIDAFTTTSKITLGILLLVFLLIFVGDYFFNYKRKGVFKISVIICYALTIAMWFADGFYWIAAFNTLLFITFLHLESRLHTTED